MTAARKVTATFSRPPSPFDATFDGETCNLTSTLCKAETYEIGTVEGFAEGNRAEIHVETGGDCPRDLDGEWSRRGDWRFGQAPVARRRISTSSISVSGSDPIGGTPQCSSHSTNCSCRGTASQSSSGSLLASALGASAWPLPASCACFWVLMVDATGPDDAASSRWSVTGRVAAIAMHPQLPALLAAVSVLLVLPSLNAGYLLDDLVHQNILSGKAQAQGPASPYGLFVFVDGNPSRVRSMIEAGALPWWSADDLQIEFWRPLTELTHGLDHALAPNVPALAHLQSLLWGAALAWLATLLYREIQGVVLAAGFAAMVFALDDAHAFPLVWLANRNILVGATFAVASLLLHVRWRRRGSKTGAVLGPACFLAALLAAEAAIAMLAYFVAYHCVYPDERSTPRVRGIAARFRPLLPYAAIALAYVATYRGLGYGVHGSGQYLDPLGEPGAYLLEALPRAVLLLAGQFATLPLALETFHYRDEVGRAISLAVAAIIAWAAVRALIAPRWARPETRFWVIGMLLSLPPALILGAFSRVLMIVGIGGAGLLGIAFEDWYGSVKLRPGRGSMLARRGLVAMHLVLAPLALVALSGVLALAMDLGEDALERLPGEESPTWVFVNPRAAFWAGGNIQASRQHRGLSAPTVRALASGAFGVTLARSSERCLEVTPGRGYLFLTADRLFRDPRQVMGVGWRRRLSEVSIEVIAEMPDARPKTVRFCFDRPLQDPSLRWIAVVGGDPEIFGPPAIGEAVSLGGQLR